MVVLIVGASGFIGARLARALAAAGYEVVCASRRPGDIPAHCQRSLQLDYTALPPPAELQRALVGIDVVINAVGILRERGRQTFDALHVRGPQALFDACLAARVRRVIQISALGAGIDAPARYHRSKYEADAHLMKSALDWAVVRPSLVYGAGGTSARLFDTLASLPWIALPGGGYQRVQPVCVDDLVHAIVQLVSRPRTLECVLVAVGPVPMTLRDFLVALRRTLGFNPTRTVAIPRSLVGLAASIGNRLPGALLDSETFGMLERGNTGDPAPLAQLLGRAPLPVESFVPPELRESRRTAAALQWLLPVMRVCVASMWLIAGIVSLGPYPVAASLALLERVGVSPGLAPFMLFGASALDFVLGVMTLLPRRSRWLWSAQIAIVVLYTVIISVQLPGLWLEPFGPVAKNIPILAMLLLLQQMEPRR